MRREECSGSVLGAHDPDRAGRCCWCKQLVARPVPKPTTFHQRSELSLAYGYFFDPDWGLNRDDVY
jgi:hypothetical protein